MRHSALVVLSLIFYSLTLSQFVLAGGPGGIDKDLFREVIYISWTRVYLRNTNFVKFPALAAICIHARQDKTELVECKNTRMKNPSLLSVIQCWRGVACCCLIHCYGHCDFTLDIRSCIGASTVKSEIVSLVASCLWMIVYCGFIAWAILLGIFTDSTWEFTNLLTHNLSVAQTAQWFLSLPLCFIVAA